MPITKAKTANSASASSSSKNRQQNQQQQQQQRSPIITISPSKGNRLMAVDQQSITNMLINQQQQQQNYSIRQVCFDIDPEQLNGYLEQQRQQQFTAQNDQIDDCDDDDDPTDNQTTSVSSISSTIFQNNNQQNIEQQRQTTKEILKNSKNLDVQNHQNLQNNQNKIKNSPKHLLYEVLLSPIKRKSRNKNNNVATSKSSSTSAAATNVDKNPQESSTKSKQNKMVSNANNNNNNNQQQQQQNRQQTSSQQSNRSQSTTPLDRNYFHHFQTKNPTNSCLFDDDPGIMSEIETSATGFNRRQTNKIRSSLPIVRTPSKSLDRSMGLVFLQFRNETKRALLPNEITSIDTVKALFVRSFPRQLSMEYLDHPSVRIYIHDPNKNMFYELEDLHDVKDRCILRIYEQSINGPQPGGGIIHQSLMAAAAAAAAQSGQFTTGGPVNVGGGHHHDGDGNYGYFSEPEFDSEYQSQHIHQRKRFPSPIVGHQSLMIGQQQTANANATNIPPQSQYYGTIMLPPQYRSATLGPLPPRSSFFINQNISGVVQPPIPPTRNKQFANFSQTLPRGTHLMNPNPVSAAMNPFAQPPPPKPQRNFPNNSVPQSGGDIIMIQGHQLARSNGQAAISSSNESSQQQPYNRPLPDRPYSVAGHYPNLDRTNPIVGTTRFQFQPTTTTNQQISGEFSGYLSSPEHHQHHRQTIPTNATLINIGQLRASFAAGGPPGHPPPPGGYPSTRLFDPNNLAGISTTAVVGNPNTFIARQQQQAASSSTSNVIDDEARIRMQEMERKIASLTNVVSKALTTGAAGPKPPPPPKPSTLVNYRTNEMNSSISIDNNNNLQQLRQIRRKARDLRQEIRQLKRFTVQQMNNAREQMKENCLKIQQTLSLLTKPIDAPIRLERIKISINCDSYNDDAIRLDRDLLELEAQVESLRSNVINRRCRVNMSNVESMALILSRASKTVADLKSRYPLLAQNLKTIMSKELHEIEKEEKFLKEEPERLEHSLKRCKKLTGTLVTLKRLASVQEQRSSNNNTSSPSSQLLQTSSSLDKKDGSIDENLPLSSSGGGGGGRDLSSSSTTTTTTLATTTTTTTTRSFDADLMEPHTIIQVIPATPSSTDSTKTTASNMLDNLLDELQTFSKQSSIDLSSSSLSNRSSPFQRTGSFRSIKSSSINNNNDDLDSDTIVRKASRSKSYSSIRATSEPPGVRSRISSIPDGRIDLDNIALLATNCGNAAAATAALLEKRFAQSRQELLEQRHQELLYKQKQLQEQYTRLQQLSKRPISSQRSGGGSGSDNNSFLNDLKKTGSENNIVSKSANLTNNNDVLMINNNNSSSTMNKMINNSNSNTIMINPTVHGSLHNINGTNNNNRNINEPTENGNIIISEMTTNTTTQVRKTFETEIL